MPVIVIRGDARHLPLPAASVDLIVTSPPYFGLRSYTDGCPTCSQVTRQKIPGYTERRCTDCGNLEQGRMRCNQCGGRTVRTEAAQAVGRGDCPDCRGTGSAHYSGQIGSEATPQEWVAALVDCTREWMRVLKPSGSLFVNLGDKYDSGTTTTRINPGTVKDGQGQGWHQGTPRISLGQPKSLLGLPWRYAIACTDQLGLTLRRDIIWNKPNGLPESVTDRCRSSHEYLFHLVKQPRYYAAVDEIREPHTGGTHARRKDGQHSPKEQATISNGFRRGYFPEDRENPLGKLPGSVWTIPSQPLTVPPHLGIDHFAAYPMELPRRCILGWSPPGICTTCGEGRRPVPAAVALDMTRSQARRAQQLADQAGLTEAHLQALLSVGVSDTGRGAATQNGTGKNTPEVYTLAGEARAALGGYAREYLLRRPTRFDYICACSRPDMPERHPDCPRCAADWIGDLDAGQFPVRTDQSEAFEQEDALRAAASIPHNHPPAEPSARILPPTRPAVVLDPFGGTGTTALVAAAYGRTGITIDRSADYSRLATWRTRNPAERAKALQVPKPPPIPDGQESLFDELEAL